MGTKAASTPRASTDVLAAGSGAADQLLRGVRYAETRTYGKVPANVFGEAINLLLTSAGRRNELVEYFRAALGGRGRIFAAGTSLDAAALQEADDAVILPPVGDAHYLEALLEFCDARIDLLVPLSVLELPTLAAARSRFAELGTRVVVGTPETVEICSDKWRTYRFLHAQGLPTPQTYLTLDDALSALGTGELEFPVVVKPRWGVGSALLTFAEDEDELELAYDLLQRRLTRTLLAGPFGTPGAGSDANLIIQAFIAGDEYSLDIVNDLSGRYAATFAKQKLALRAGETDGAVTVWDRRLERLGSTLGQALGHAGSVECDVFLSSDGAAHVLEINACLGSGYPFAHVAGADLPAALVAWALGETPDPAWLRAEAGVRSVRSSRLLLSRA